jgi:hypothetical protein
VRRRPGSNRVCKQENRERGPCFGKHAASGGNSARSAAHGPSASATNGRAAAGNPCSDSAARAGKTSRAAAPPPAAAGSGRTCASQTRATADFATTFRQRAGNRENKYDFKHHDSRKEPAPGRWQTAQRRSKRPHRKNQRLSQPGSRSHPCRRLGSRAKSCRKGAGAFHRTREIVLV